MVPDYSFNDTDRSIEIFNASLPSPWINYLSNGELHAFVTQSGGGFLWWKSPILFRLTRFRGNQSPVDAPGFYLYLREENGTVWSPTFPRFGSSSENFTCCHKPGITTFHVTHNGLSSKTSLFIAPENNVLVWRLQLLNARPGPVKISLFPYCEPAQMSWRSDLDWGYYIRHKQETRWNADSQSLQYLFRMDDHPRLDDIPLLYLASDYEILSYTGSRLSFLGPGRDESDPHAVHEGGCDNKTLSAGDPAMALHQELELAPAQEVTLSYFLGTVPSALRNHEQAVRQMKRDLASFRKQGWVDSQLGKLSDSWDHFLSRFQAKVKDPVVSRQVNTWTPVNCVHTGRYSRSVNAEAPGIRGVGFRDTCQDMIALAPRDPGWATESLRFLLQQQFADGHAVHYAYPEEQSEPVLSIHSDDHLWLPLLAYAILAETADYTLLDETLPYFDGSEGTVWEHLMALVSFTEAHLGSHGLPLILKSDWNDIIGRFAREGRGESSFAALQYVVALKRLIKIARKTWKSHDTGRLEDCLYRQLGAIKRSLWDGNWWLRGFDDDGKPVGSNGSSFGQIFLNPQSWAVLAEIGTEDQRVHAMDAVHQRLDTGIGLKILDPGFETWPDVSDPFSGYARGCGENGAIFCHANTWAIMAEALLGRANQAWQYYRQLIPENVINKVGMDRYRGEPYAWCSNIVGPENENFGWGNVTQVTGTAAWMEVAVTQYLLGLRPELDGLLIKPCLPNDFGEVTLFRHFAGCDLTISIPPHMEAGSFRPAPHCIEFLNPVNGGWLLPREEAVSRKSLHLEFDISTSTQPPISQLHATQ